MRQIGTLPKGIDPKVFADYLLTLGIKTRVDERPDGWLLWIYNEDHVARAGEELQGLSDRPDDPRYQKAVDAAEAIRRRRAGARQGVSEKLSRSLRPLGLPGRAPATPDHDPGGHLRGRLFHAGVAESVDGRVDTALFDRVPSTRKADGTTTA